MLTPGRRACSAFGLLPQQESTAATHLQDLGLWQEGHVPLGLPHLLLCHANPKASPASAALSSVTSHTPMLQAMPQGSPKSDQGHPSKWPPLAYTQLHRLPTPPCRPRGLTRTHHQLTATQPCRTGT